MVNIILLYNIIYIYHIIIRTRVYTVARGSDLYNFLTEVENLCGWRLNRLEDIQEREREREREREQARTLDCILTCSPPYT